MPDPTTPPPSTFTAQVDIWRCPVCRTQLVADVDGELVHTPITFTVGTVDGNPNRVPIAANVGTDTRLIQLRAPAHECPTAPAPAPTDPDDVEPTDPDAPTDPARSHP